MASIEVSGDELSTVTDTDLEVEDSYGSLATLMVPFISYAIVTAFLRVLCVERWFTSTTNNVLAN
jgi:hypothetical protein